ncbi:YD repeat-containing protein [Asticcacaulis solisilvae]|nr:YD repeat-containing protein [Asticcacaulis solisilvae]MDR6800462.1 YD repeat-containing protein [Asticcacaulis sp. BE141]
MEPGEGADGVGVGWDDGQASYAYDANGNLSQVNDSGVGPVVTYQTDSFGQVLSRKETSNSQKGAYRKRVHRKDQCPFTTVEI